jgi:hypothetical protein
MYMRNLKRHNFLPLAWLLLHVILLRILADRTDLFPVVFGRYSIAYTILLAVIALVGIGGTLWAWRNQPASLPRWLQALRTRPPFHVAVIGGGILLLLTTWLTPFQMPTTSLQRELLRGYASAAILTVTYFALFWCGRDALVSWRSWLVVAGVGASAAIFLTVHYLDRFPQLNRIDELHNWVVQWTYANTGLLGDALYRQMIPLPQPIYDSPHYVLGWLLRFIGDTFWQARFARLLMACLALPFIYLAGKRMYGKQTGLLAAVVALILLAPTAYVRPDVFVGVMLSIALYVYLRAQESRRPLMHYLTGLCVALAGEGHPLAYRFGIAFALLYGVRWLYQMWQARRLYIDGRLIALGLGGFTGMLIYLAIHILPNMDQGLHFATNYSPISRTAKEQLDAAFFILMLQLEVWIGTSPFELLFVALGVAIAVSEFKHGDRVLLMLLVVSELLMLATYGYYREFYQVHFLPVFSLLAGRALANLSGMMIGHFPAGAGRRSTLVLVSMVLVVSLGSLAQTARSASKDTNRDEFMAIARQLKHDLPRDAIVVGAENYFMEIRSLNYYGIQTITTDQWFKVKYQGYELWKATNPDIFILTNELDTSRYTDLWSIYRYMDDNGFKFVRCYTETGLIRSHVYVRKMPSGWEVDSTCRRYGAPAFVPLLTALTQRKSDNADNFYVQLTR